MMMSCYYNLSILFHTAGFWILRSSPRKPCYSLWDHSLCSSRSNESRKEVPWAYCFRVFCAFLCWHCVLLPNSHSSSLEFLCELCGRGRWVTVVHWSILWVCASAHVQHWYIFSGKTLVCKFIEWYEFAAFFCLPKICFVGTFTHLSVELTMETSNDLLGVFVKILWNKTVALRMKIMDGGSQCGHCYQNGNKEGVLLPNELIIGI